MPKKQNQNKKQITQIDRRKKEKNYQGKQYSNLTSTKSIGTVEATSNQNTMYLHLLIYTRKIGIWCVLRRTFLFSRIVYCNVIRNSNCNTHYKRKL